MGEMTQVTHEAASHEAAPEEENGKARQRKVVMVKAAVSRGVSPGNKSNGEAETAEPSHAWQHREEIDEAASGQRPASAATTGREPQASTLREGEQEAPIDARRERLQKHQIWLLTVCRGIFQMARICFGPLVVSMATEYAYSPVEKGMVLSAFSVGYAFTQILGGLAADYLGGKPLLVLGLLTSAGSLFLVPIAADAGIHYLWWLLCFMGLTQGPTYPAQQVAQAKWATTTSLRSYAGNLGGAGSTLGSLLALGSTPILAGRIGWRSTAWFFGTVTALVGVLEACVGGSAPAWIQRHEGGGNSVANAALVSVLAKFRRRFKLLMALPVLATFAAHSTHNFVRYFLMAWMPTYYREVLEVSEDASGLHMLIPELCGLISSITIASLGLGTKLPPLTTRRLFSSIAFLGAFVGLISVSMVRTPVLVTFFLFFVQGLATLQGSGFGQSYTEVSKHSVGLVTGVGNTVATGASFLAPVFASWLIPKDSVAGPEDWKALFISFASANLVGLLIYSTSCSVTPVDLDEDGDNVTTNGTRPHAQ